MVDEIKYVLLLLLMQSIGTVAYIDVGYGRGDPYGYRR